MLNYISICVTFIQICSYWFCECASINILNYIVVVHWLYKILVTLKMLFIYLFWSWSRLLIFCFILLVLRREVGWVHSKVRFYNESRICLVNVSNCFISRISKDFARAIPKWTKKWDKIKVLNCTEPHATNSLAAMDSIRILGRKY